MNHKIWLLAATNLEIPKSIVNWLILLWDKAKEKAVLAVNSELLDANWQTGQYIVEFEQDGKTRAQYGKQLLVNLSKKEGVLAYVLIDLKRAEIKHSDRYQLYFPKREELQAQLDAVLNETKE